MLSLCCVIEGENIAFLVDVPAQARVSALKKEIQSERAWSILRDVDPHTLELWKPRDINAIVAKPADTLLERLRSMGASLSDFAEKLEATDSLSNIFSTQPSMEHIQIVVRITAASFHYFRGTPEERPFKRHHSERSEVRKWNVNGTIRRIDISGSYYLDPGLQKASTDCLTAVESHPYVLLSGARASGKSTRLLWLKNELEKMGYKALYFSFEEIDYRGTVNQFWKSIGQAIQPNRNPIHPIESQHTFLGAFLAENWAQKVVLLIDELSELHSASEDVRDDFLRTLRATRNNPEPYAIKSIIAAGTFSILRLNPSQPTIPPFNISDRIDNPYFTAEETRTLFDAFAQDHGIIIEDAVVEDIWLRSNGYFMLLTLSYWQQEIEDSFNRISKRHPNTCLFSLQMRLGWSISPVKMIFIRFGNLIST